MSDAIPDTHVSLTSLVDRVQHPRHEGWLTGNSIGSRMYDTKDSGCYRQDLKVVFFFLKVEEKDFGDISREVHIVPDCC